ncbi:Bud-site selection protein [Syncephalis plumigaleata]|nr:Bud-site selection protein [Syncephalis plumigaleata]
MPKRTRKHLAYAIRRLEAKDGEVPVDRVVHLKEEKIRKKLHTIQKELRKDTKKARAFCLQRIIKRIKAEKAETLSKEESIKKRDVRLQQLDKELTALKAINIDDVAMRTFDAAIRGHSQLTSYATMQRILKDPNVLYLEAKKTKKEKATTNDTPPVTDSTAERTLVEAKAMQNAVERAVEGVLTTVQFLEGERDHTPRELKKAEKKMKEKPAAATSTTASSKNEKTTSTASMFMTSLNDQRKREEVIAASDESAAEDDDEEEKDWDSDISQPVYSDDDDDDDEDEVEHEEQGKNKKLAFMKEDIEEEPVIDYDISMSEDEGPSNKKSKTIKKKKNRPGQQARRKMNEEKYGRNAHHIRKQMEEERLMRHQPPPLTGANAVRRAFKPNNLSQHTHTSQRHTTTTRKHSTTTAMEQTSHNKPLLKSNTTVDASAHPSWEAKRRQKEQEAALLRAKPSGTKIVFDDDD